MTRSSAMELGREDVCVLCSVLCAVYFYWVLRVGLGPDDVSLIREIQRVLCPLKHMEFLLIKTCFQTQQTRVMTLQRSISPYHSLTTAIEEGASQLESWRMWSMKIAKTFK